jgi:hypothetical protein
MRHHLVADATEYPAHLTFQAPLVQNLMAFTQFAFGGAACLVPRTLSAGAFVVVSCSDFFARNQANDFHLLVNDPAYRATFPAMCLRTRDRSRNHDPSGASKLPHNRADIDRAIHKMTEKERQGIGILRTTPS